MTLQVMILLFLGLSSFYSIASSQTLRPLAEDKSLAEDKRARFLREANANRLKRTTELAHMDEPRLTAELRRESLEGIAPVNSFAYKEVLRRGSVFASPLAGLLTAPDQSSFLGLLALRRINPTVYRKLSATFRVKVLVDALAHAKSFNAWGLPNLRLNEAAEALIEEKDAARPALVLLLQTTGSRKAPVLGLKSHDVYEKYQYRVSDYAMALLNEINGQRKELPVDPILRDRLIDELARRNGLPQAVAPVDHVGPAPPHGLTLGPHGPTPVPPPIP